MNFLGHIYFSDNDLSLMHANLYGDYIKGSDLSHLDPQIKMGVLLHRQIDNYIDHHEAVVELMRILYPHLPKVTGIAIDLFFDHLLAKNWNKFHAVRYTDFLSTFYAHDITNNTNYSKEFRVFMSTLKSKNWMIHYDSPYGLRKMCEGVSSRISFPNELKNAPLIFTEFEQEIEQTFFTFMAQAQPHFKTIRETLKQQLLDE
jgi:acyl carrier protein phosphodiesterase